jgi:hypothetical protein
MMALDPVGNNPTGGDGLNTTGFRGNARSPLTKILLRADSTTS